MSAALEVVGFYATLLHRESAIVLEAGQAYLLEARLGPIARELGLATVADLADVLRTNPRRDLVTRVVDAMTTNETTFFRDVQPFETLRQSVLPALIAARRNRTLTIWSAACSTGQEAYSIAMLIAEHFAQLATWNVQILGTDLSTQVLERAKAGRYHQLEVNRGLPAKYLAKYFERDGTHWQLKDTIRNKVQWKRMNLAMAWPSLPVFDVVFLRNVLIYFDLPTKQSILKRARQRLAPDGYFFVGSTETTLNVDSQFVRAPFERSSCYRLAAGG